MTQVFPHGGAAVTHPEKGTFKVNTQRLKPYFGGDFHANKQTIPLNTLISTQKVSCLVRSIPQHCTLQHKNNCGIRGGS